MASLKRLTSSSTLKSWVLVWGYSSPGSGSGHVHPGGDAVGHDASRRAVLGPVRHRVAEVLAKHPFERLDFPGVVEAPEQIVERSVLEEHQHHVVHRIRSYRGHRSSLGGGERPYAIAAPGWSESRVGVPGVHTNLRGPRPFPRHECSRSPRQCPGTLVPTQSEPQHPEATLPSCAGFTSGRHRVSKGSRDLCIRWHTSLWCVAA